METACEKVMQHIPNFITKLSLKWQCKRIKYITLNTAYNQNLTAMNHHLN